MEEVGIKEGEFLVCMVTKEVAKPAARASAATSAASQPPQTGSAPSSTPAATPAAGATAAAAATTSPPLTTNNPSAPSSAPSTTTPPAPPSVEISEEALAQLVTMGFREAEARYALVAARGNGDLAVEFLTNGIPEQLETPTASSTTPASGASDGPLDRFRSHPQFTQLQQLVQSNPASLTQVLELIGQQDPELLATIHANHDAFVQMMNEPIVERPPANAGTGAGLGYGGMPGMPGGTPGPDPTQILAALQHLPEAQRAQTAAQLGMSPEQLQQLTQYLSSMPPGQLQNMYGAMGAGGFGSMGGMGGMGDIPPSANVIRLTPEELASVRRLQDLGFSEQEAVQAYILCDKNEEWAANMLFEGGLTFEGDEGFDGSGGDETH